MDKLLTIVITTHNRPNLMKRALSSINRQMKNENEIEIIVIDDCSKNSYEGLIPNGVVYHRMEVNSGPGPARMYGLSVASGKWVLMLDDDDTMADGSIMYLIEFLDNYENKYPVIQMARTNGVLSGKDRVINFSDYMNGRISGEFTPIFNKELTMIENLAYPCNLAGGEHILWWEVSKKFGIPTYSKIIVDLHHDSENRLTNSSSQIKNSKNHLELANLTLEKFGKEMREEYPKEYKRVCMAKASYALLSGNRKDVLSFLHLSGLNKKVKIVFLILTFLPRDIIKILFLKYRGKQKC